MLKVKFNPNIDVVHITGLTQWDKNRKLIISGLNLNTFEVHFGNVNSPDAIRMMAATSGSDVVCEIPNSLLEEPYEIRAYIYARDKDESLTIKTICIKVQPRPRPQDFVSENNGGDIIHDLLNKIDKVVSDTQAFKNEITAQQAQFEANATIEHQKIRNEAHETFVPKEIGKGLSTNDLTNELKQKILNAGDYNNLINKPQIENVALSGNLTLQDFGIVEISNQEILEIAKSILFTEGI